MSGMRTNIVITKISFFDGKKLYANGTELEKRVVKDYELEYHIESSGSVVTNGINIPISAGDIILRKPNQIVQGIMPYTCYVIFFNLLSGNTDDNTIIEELISKLPIKYNYSRPYKQYFEEIFNSSVSPNEYSPLLFQSNILKILYSLIDDYQNSNTTSKLMGSPHYQSINKIHKYINANLSEPIHISELSKLVGISTGYLHRIFKSTLNITPSQYITELRIENAKKLLLNLKKSISDISVLCGFQSFAYFSHVFKNHVGVTPREFRHKHCYY